MSWQPQNPPDLVGPWSPPSNSLETEPNRWLTAEVERLHTILRPDKVGACRPYVRTPDNIVHTRSDRLWNNRHWASIEYEPRRGFARKWEIVRTTVGRPHTDFRVVPILRTIEPAKEAARRRAQGAHARRRERQERENDVAWGIETGPDNWDSAGFHGFLASMSVERARWIMVRLLVHVQCERCAVCQHQYRKLVLDHDHATGLVRGALCNGCNGAEGWTVEARPELVEPLRKYRANPPATRFGWTFPTSLWSVSWPWR